VLARAIGSVLDTREVAEMQACRLAWKILVSAAFVVSSFFVTADLANAQAGDELDSLNQQFTRSYQAGNLPEALTLGLRALALAEQHFGPEHPFVASYCSNLGRLYLMQGQFADAERQLQRSLAILEKSRSPDSRSIAMGLNDLAQVYRGQGRDREAEPLLKKSLQILESALGVEDFEVSVALNNLAALYDAQGKAAEAESLLKRSLAIVEKAFGPDHPQIAQHLNNLAMISSSLGRLAEAEALYRRSLTISENALGPTHPLVGASLNNLARIYQVQGLYGQAEEMSKRSLSIAERTLRPDHPDLVYYLNNLAVLYRVQGRNADAEALYQRSLTISERALSPDHPFVSLSLNNLGTLHFVQNNWAAALSFWERSTGILIRRALLGGEALSQGQVNSAQGDVTRLRGSSMGLIKAAYRSNTTETGHATSLMPAMFQYAQWAQTSVAAASLAQMAARHVKGRAVLSALVRERQDLVGEWHDHDTQLTALLSQSLERRDLAGEQRHRARLASIDARIAEIDKTFTRDFPDYAALTSPAPLSIAQVQAELRDDEVLVLFLDIVEFEQTPEETFVWAVSRTQSRWLRIDVGTRGLAERVAALRCGLDARLWDDAADWPETTEEAAQQRTAQIDRRQRCKELLKAEPVTELVDSAPVQVLPFDVRRAHELYQGLLGPVEDMIRGKRLIVVPSGPLTSLPFNVLVTKAPPTAIPGRLADYRQATWLGAEQPITVLPSVASLKALRLFAKSSQASKSYLGIGNPLIDGPQNDVRWGAHYRSQAVLARTKRCAMAPVSQQITSARAPRSTPAFASLFRGARADIEHVRLWTPLPETADELCEVGRRLGVPESDILLGSHATEGKIKELSEQGRLANYAIVHFATHGALTGQVQGAAEPGLILTPPEKGTNEPRALERDDGFLTASEIATLKLDADWVILSACNTAGAENENAEALSGMARAFFYAGARTLLISHWEVGSDAAVKLTTQAFAQLTIAPNIGRAEAMRISMRNLIRHGTLAEAHPSMWAPFVIVGEGGGSESPPVQSTVPAGSVEAPVLSKPAGMAKKKVGATKRLTPDWRTELWRQ
jgi:CHAT domain-containing protein/tetratricopeptide (TPR) repeat protein